MTVAVVILLCAALCASATYGVCRGVENMFDVFFAVAKLLPEPKPWVPPPEPPPEDEGEPLFKDLLQKLPKPIEPPKPYYYAPRAQGEDRNWPSGFYREPEPEADMTPISQPEQQLVTIPQPDVDCQPAVFLVNEMKWACLDTAMDDDAPPTIEPPLDICDFRYCPYRFHSPSSPIIGVF